jgi:hypothetical protein
LKSKEFREKKILRNTGLQTSTMRRPRSQLGYCCFADRINPLNAEINSICHLLALLGAQPILHVSRIRVNMVNSVTNTGGITAAGSDLRHFSDRIKALYMKKYVGHQTLTSASYLYSHFGTRRMAHLCSF